MLLAPSSSLPACRSPLLAACSKLLASLVFATSGLIAPTVFGQAGEAILDKTTLGSSQNDARDLQNSLIPGPKRYGKGEKKEEVDLKTLHSKSIKDPAFQGNLMDLDLDWRGDKFGKPATNGDKAQKKTDGTGEKDSKVSQQADKSGESDSPDANFTAGAREPLANRPREAGDSVSGKPRDRKASKSAQGGDDQNKDQKAKSSAASDEKSSEKEKASPSKPDGDR